MTFKVRIYYHLICFLIVSGAPDRIDRSLIISLWITNMKLLHYDRPQNRTLADHSYTLTDFNYILTVQLKPRKQKSRDKLLKKIASQNISNYVLTSY